MNLISSETTSVMVRLAYINRRCTGPVLLLTGRNSTVQSLSGPTRYVFFHMGEMGTVVDVVEAGELLLLSYILNIMQNTLETQMWN